MWLMPAIPAYVATMSTVPSRTPDTFPCWSTVAIVGLLVAHSGVASVRTSPFGARMTALSCAEASTYVVSSAGVTTMLTAPSCTVIST